jgi:hypothetical protein
MCYSAESSIGTFLFVTLICIYLWKKGKNIYKAISIILFVIALMQLLEFFIWKNIECDSKNQFISFFIPIILFLQPLIVATSVLYYQVGLLPTYIYKLLIFIWILCLPFFINWMKDGFGKCTTIGTKGNLSWPYANSSKPLHQCMQFLYNFILGISIVSLDTKWYGFFYIIIATYSYYYIRQNYHHSWGSVWCNFVNILALGALFI